MQAISLMYHDVTSDSASSGFSGADAQLYKISPEAFSAQLKAIALKIAMRPILVTQWQHQPRPFFVGFDDGGKSALTAAEILESYGWRGHFFITTSKIGHPAFVNRADIRQLHERGHLIGSHSDSHPLRMASLSPKTIFTEWEVSTQKLADIIGMPIQVASVPGGMYSTIVAACAAANGIRFLFNSEPVTQIQHVHNCTILGRYMVQNRMTTEEIAAIAAGAFLPRYKQYSLWNIKKPLKRLGGEQFLRLRKFLIEHHI